MVVNRNDRNLRERIKHQVGLDRIHTTQDEIHFQFVRFYGNSIEHM